MLLDYLTPLLSSPWLYVIIFAAVAIDGFIPVVPTDVAVIGLGALSATGSPNLVALAAVVVAGGIAGDRVTYLLGRKAGGRVTDGKLAVVKKKAERALMRYGGVVILVGRFLPYGRTATALTAGSMSVPLGRFRLFTALASVAWAVYAIGLGRLGGATFAGSPLLGAGCAMVFGVILTSVFALGGKRRGTAADQRCGPDSRAARTRCADRLRGGRAGFAVTRRSRPALTRNSTRTCHQPARPQPARRRRCPCGPQRRIQRRSTMSSSLSIRLSPTG